MAQPCGVTHSLSHGWAATKASTLPSRACTFTCLACLRVCARVCVCARANAEACTPRGQQLLWSFHVKSRLLPSVPSQQRATRAADPGLRVFILTFSCALGYS